MAQDKTTRPDVTLADATPEQIGQRIRELVLNDRDAVILDRIVDAAAICFRCGADQQGNEGRDCMCGAEI